MISSCARSSVLCTLMRRHIGPSSQLFVVGRILPRRIISAACFSSLGSYNNPNDRYHFNQTRSFHRHWHLSRESRLPEETQTMDQKTAAKGNQRERLKLAVREYGATVIVFHTCISLCTLGISYAAVSRFGLAFGVMQELCFSFKGKKTKQINLFLAGKMAGNTFKKDTIFTAENECL